MKLSVSAISVCTLLLTPCTVNAFAPPMAARHGQATTTTTTSRFMATQHFADISSMIQTFTSMTMADAAEQGANGVSSSGMAAMMDQLVNVAPTAVAPVADSSGMNGLMDKLMDSAPVASDAATTSAPAAAAQAAATTATAAAVAVATQTAAPADGGGWFGFLSAPPAVDSATSAVATAQSADEAALAATAATAAAADNGWFGFLTAPIAVLIQVIHGMLVAVGLDSNAWGISIILLTLLIKAVTFPLTKTQLESTNKMQAMQPAIKEIQAKYQSNQEVMNQKMAEFYQQNDINPLAGCLPSLVQIPVFIGLYRAVLQLASANELDEPFLFLPNLEGPTYGADPAHGSDWLFGEWVNNVPPLGWDDTLAFLILPVFLVISQFVSMELMQPKTQDPAQQQTNVILKVLPIMIGWFALNVPAALSVYWVVNNIVTTATSLIIRNTMKVEPIKTGGGGAAAAAVKPPPTIFAPPPQKPVGFGATSAASPKIPRDAVKPITAIDAEIVAPPKPAPAPAPVQPAPAPAPVAEAAPAAVREEATYDNDDAVKEMTSNAPESTSVYKKKRGKSSKKRKSN